MLTVDFNRLGLKAGDLVLDRCGKQTGGREDTGITRHENAVDAEFHGQGNGM